MARISFSTPILLLAITISASAAVTVVPGSSCPWLAGMPTGTFTQSGDRAPDQSPVLVGGVTITGGTALAFTVTGSVSNFSNPPTDPPDGNANNVVANTGGREFGLSNIIAPINCLVGVFLDDRRPDETPDATTLDFSEVGDRNFATLSPQLKQIFFIGNGRRGTTGGEQTFFAPAGSTRLFLGSIDAFGWTGNGGQFQVGVTVVPTPGVLGFMGLAGSMAARYRRR